MTEPRRAAGRAVTRRQALGALASVGALSLAGCSTFSSISSLGGVSPRWRLDIESASATSPVAATDSHVFVGGQDKHLHAISVDGTHEFSVETGGPIEDRPAVPANTDKSNAVHAHSTDGDLYAVSASGDRLWHAEGITARGRPFRAGSLVVDLDYDRDVAVGHDAASGTRRFETPVRAFRLPGLTREAFAVPVPASGEQSQLTVFDHEGEVLWQLEPSRAYPDVLAVDSHIFVHQLRSVAAHDLSTGETRWTMGLGTVDHAQLLDVGPDVYLRLRPDTGRERLLALDASSGEEQYRVTGGYDVRAIAPTADAVFVVGSEDNGDDGVLGRVDRIAHDGTRDWTTVTDVQRFEDLITVGELVIAVADRQLVALDPETGEERWHHASVAGSRIFPTVDGDRLYLSYRDRGAIARFPTGL